MNKKFKKFFLTIFASFFFVELTIQLSFLLGLNFVKQPILFYNPYCDQRYWSLLEKKILPDLNIDSHPLLSFKKKNIEIPDNFDNNKKFKDLKNELTFYGSSYINHKYFNALLDQNNLSYKNYALDSYGLDQIYLSYKLTSHQNVNKTIIIGFLLEDLDRSLFSKRDYSKVKYAKKNQKFIINQLPRKNYEVKRENDIYLYRFIKNFTTLLQNEFDPRHSECEIKFKKDIFSFFINDIKEEAKKLNQKLIIVSFNLKEDFVKNPSWRYNFIKKELDKNSVIHIDSLEILKKVSKSDVKQIDKLFGEDLHNSEEGFKYIFEKIKTKL